MAGTPAPPFNVLKATAIELEPRLDEGSLTGVQIIETYLAQIKKLSHAGAKLNAMVTVAPRELVLK
jgi:amidase